MTLVGDADPPDMPSHTDDLHEASRAARSGDQPGDRTAGLALPAAALWNVEDVSGYLRVPASAIYKMTTRAAAVRIPHIRIGGRLRFRQQDVDHWLSLLTTSNLRVLQRIRQKASPT